MGKSNKSGGITSKDWEHMLGKDIGTGSGAQLDIEEWEQTGQIITGYELIELASSAIGDKPFSLSYFFQLLNVDLKDRLVVMVERPAPGNQFGKFRFDNTHQYYQYGFPPGIERKDWVQDVLNGLDPGLHK